MLETNSITQRYIADVRALYIDAFCLDQNDLGEMEREAAKLDDGRYLLVCLESHNLLSIRL